MFFPTSLAFLIFSTTVYKENNHPKRLTIETLVAEYKLQLKGRNLALLLVTKHGSGYSHRKSWSRENNKKRKSNGRPSLGRWKANGVL